MATDAYLYDMLLEVRSTIQGLNLPGIAPANVLIHKVATNRPKDLPDDKYPCIIIAEYAPEVSNAQDGSNLRDDIAYQIGIWHLASDKLGNEQPTEQQDNDHRLYIKIRQAIRQAFISQRLTTTVGFRVEFQALGVDRQVWLAKGLWIDGRVLKIWNREVRN
jgi:hypothetical protein